MTKTKKEEQEELETLKSIWLEDLDHYWETEINKVDYEKNTEKYLIDSEKWYANLTLEEVKKLIAKFNQENTDYLLNTIRDAIEIPIKRIENGQETTTLTGDFVCYDDWNIVNEPHLVLCGQQDQPNYLITITRIDN